MIKISDKYSIKADMFNYMVVQHGVNKKTGEETEIVVGFVKDIRHALDVIYKRETRAWVRDNDATLREAVKVFSAIANDITEFGKKYEFNGELVQPEPKPKAEKAEKVEKVEKTKKVKEPAATKPKPRKRKTK